MSATARSSERRLPAERPSLRCASPSAGIDGRDAAGVPAALFVLALFVYPFLYGLVLSFQPKEGGALANYARFFSDPFLYEHDRHHAAGWRCR